MKRFIIKSLVCILAFIITAMITSRFLNHENIDITEEMPATSFPIMYMVTEGERTNCLHGFANDMNDTMLRDTISPIGLDRLVEFQVEGNVNDINQIRYEVRSVGDNRLIENDNIEIHRDKNISGKIALKDLYEDNKEYSLIIILCKESKEIKYYTRIVEQEDYQVLPKIDFVKDFHNKTFDKAEAKSLVSYLETDSTGDNTTFAKTNIHSNLEQVTWGELQVFEETDPDIEIQEIGKNVATMSLRYVISMPGEVDKDYYYVVEYYRIRQTADRFYLLNFERDVQELYTAKRDLVQNKKINLGITDKDINVVESDGGNIVSFVAGKKLYLYNAGDNAFITVFGFYSGDYLDKQSLYDKHDIKILSVDEMGNIYFCVYGYMNRGKREGESGIEIYYYDYALNSIEEKTFIREDRSYKNIEADTKQLAFLDSRQNFYTINNQQIISINIESKNTKTIVENLKTGAYVVSDSNETIAWKDGERNEAIPLNIKNLSTGRVSVVGENASETIIPLGFMGNDLICGYAVSKAVEDANGENIPMYKILVENSNGDILMQYEKDQTYIVNAKVKDNQITLGRISANGGETIADDQILSTKNIVQLTTKVEAVYAEEKCNIVEIALNTASDKGNTKIITPKYNMQDYTDGLVLPTVENPEDVYYIYGIKGINSTQTKASIGVLLSERDSAVLINQNGKTIWKPGENLVKNQIMKINGEISDSERCSLAVCLDIMLSFAGVQRRTQSELDNGKTAMEILSENMGERTVLDLTGCSLKSVLYYISNEKPVLALTGKNEAVLIVGYNEYNTVLMNPATGEVKKYGMQDSERFFSQYGNRFISYID